MPRLAGSVKPAEFSTTDIGKTLSEGDPQELLEARRFFEPEIARLAALYRDSDDLTRLFEVVDRMRTAEESGNFDKYLEADFFFHLALAYATHNPLIIDMARVVVERMKAPPWRAATNTILPNYLTVNRAEHGAVLNAVAARKPREAQQTMASHLASTARNLRNISAFADFDDRGTKASGTGHFEQEPTLAAPNPPSAFSHGKSS